MKRLTNKNYIPSCIPQGEDVVTLDDVMRKLIALEDIEEEIGIDLVTLFGALKEKKAYLCFVDDEWCVCDMQTDAILDLNNGQ